MLRQQHFPAFGRAGYSPKFVVFSFPKSGTHFIKSFYSNLTHEAIDHDHVHHYRNFTVEKLLRKYRDTGIIFAYRDPRDALISYISWVDKLTIEQNARAIEFGHKEWSVWATERKLIEVISGTDQSTMLKNIVVLPELVARFAGNPRVCVVRFEDFIGPSAGGDLHRQLEAMQKVAQFIVGRQLEDSEISSILEDSWGRDATFNDPKIGKWRDYFTPNVTAAFKKSVWNDVLVKLDYESDDRW